MRMCKRKTIWLSKPLCCGILAILMFCLLVLARCQPRHDQIKTTAAIAAGQTVPVLMYHHLLPRDTDSPLKSNNIVTFTEDFAAQLGWLRDNGYHTISVAELEAFLYEGAVLPEHPIMLTFDDGYMSNYVYAAPLLREYGFTAVIFTITSQIAQDGSASSADQAVPQTREMMEACQDVFTYASHTDNLHTATGSGRSALTDADPAAAAADLHRSLDSLAGIPGGNPRIFSYPYGFYNDRVKAVLRENGVRMAFRATAGQLTRDSDPYALPRIAISHKVDIEQFAELVSGS